jgi:hypothetical protein
VLGLRLVQPGGPTDRFTALFPPFQVKTEAEYSLKKSVDITTV